MAQSITRSPRSLLLTAPGIPAGVGFAIRIDDEQMVVTSNVGNTLNLTRGANGTTAVNHSSGAGVNLAFDQRRRRLSAQADGPDANTAQTLDIGAFEAGASIEDISDKSTNEDVPLPTFTLNVGDAATPFSNIIATSSEPDLVPNGNIVIGADTASTELYRLHQRRIGLLCYHRGDCNERTTKHVRSVLPYGPMQWPTHRRLRMPLPTRTPKPPPGW